MQHILVVGAGYIGSHMVWLLGRRRFGILAAAKVAR
jgi:UDP-glucose 4-epimerase